jgi:hypothetical protein
MVLKFHHRRREKIATVSRSRPWIIKNEYMNNSSYFAEIASEVFIPEHLPHWNKYRKEGPRRFCLRWNFSANTMVMAISLHSLSLLVFVLSVWKEVVSLYIFFSLQRVQHQQKQKELQDHLYADSSLPFLYVGGADAGSLHMNK